MSTMSELADVVLFRERARRDPLPGLRPELTSVPPGAIVKHIELEIPGRLLGRIDLLSTFLEQHLFGWSQNVSAWEIFEADGELVVVADFWKPQRPRTLLNRRASRRTNTPPRWQR